MISARKTILSGFFFATKQKLHKPYPQMPKRSNNTRIKQNHLHSRRRTRHIKIRANKSTKQISKHSLLRCLNGKIRSWSNRSIYWSKPIIKPSFRKIKPSNNFFKSSIIFLKSRNKKYDSLNLLNGLNKKYTNLLNLLSKFVYLCKRFLNIEKLWNNF